MSKVVDSQCTNLDTICVSKWILAVIEIETIQIVTVLYIIILSLNVFTLVIYKAAHI